MPVAAVTELAATQENAEAFGEVDAADRSQPLPIGPDVTDPLQRRRLQEISDSYVEADTLALQYGASSTRVFQWLAIIAAAMGFFFLVYAKVATIAPYIIAYLVLRPSRNGSCHTSRTVPLQKRLGFGSTWLASMRTRRSMSIRFST
jgi:hypothetical protein